MQTDPVPVPANGVPPADLPRPDVDIEEDVQRLIRNMPQLRVSQPWLRVAVQNGIVTITGNIRGVTAKHLLRDRVPQIVGVKLMNLSELYDDESVEYAIGEKLPPGLYATSQFGAVALTGSLPLHVDPQALLKDLEGVPGVRKVSAYFDGG